MLVAERSEHVVKQVRRGMSGGRDGASGVALHALEVGGMKCGICWKCRGQFLWLVQLRGGDQRDLRIDNERWWVGALVLWFIAVRKGVGANGRGGVGTATVRDIRAFSVGVAIGRVGVEGAGDIDEAGGIVDDVFVAVAVGDSIGIEGAGNVDKADVVVKVVVAVAGGVDQHWCCCWNCCCSLLALLLRLVSLLMMSLLPKHGSSGV